MRKKKLIIKLIRALIVVILLAGGMGFAFVMLTGKIDDVNSDIGKLSASKIKNKGDFENVKKEVANSKDGFDFYLKFKGSKDSNPDNFRRAKIVEILGDIKSDLSLTSLSLKTEEFKALGGKQYDKEGAVTKKATISLAFDSVDDIRVMKLLREIETRFPGHVYFKKFEMDAKKDDITESDLLRVSSGQELDFVSGDIEFDWYQIDEKEIEPEEGNDV